MRKKLYGNGINPTCEYCAYAKKSANGRVMLCTKKGVVPLYHHCRRFLYDPVKRIPFRQPPLMKYDKENFQL